MGFESGELEHGSMASRGSKVMKMAKMMLFWTIFQHKSLWCNHLRRKFAKVTFSRFTYSICIYFNFISLSYYISEICHLSLSRLEVEVAERFTKNDDSAQK
jgi:hypothetical protein